MRVDTMKRQIDLHAWVGIVAGLALFVAAEGAAAAATACPSMARPR